MRSRWSASLPTRFVAIDGLLPEPVAHSIHRAFPPNADGLSILDSFRERKRTSADLAAHPPLLRAVSAALQHPELIEAVGQITGMESLEPDPSLYAGGLSMMFKGDFLNPHIDNSHDGAWRRYRRLNLLYYVTPDWTAENGGQLELWDEGVRRPITIEARFNRMVIMETGRTSWHSVSPVTADRARCCMSSYYFSPTSPDGTEYYHVTSFTGRPGQTFRRAVAGIDNRLRQAVRRLFGRQRI